MFLKKICIALILAICFWTNAFANKQVQVSLSESQVNLGESIQLVVSFDPGVSTGEIELSIPGIENFQVFSQSQQQKTRSINGNAQTQFQYTLQLRPQQEGTYTLGPVQINLGDTILTDDEKLSVQVGNSRSSSQSISPALQTPENQENLATEIAIKPELKPLRNFEFSQALKIVLGILFFVVFFMLLKKYLDSKKTDDQEVPKNIPETKIEKLKKYFQKLEKNSANLESQDFYKKLNIGMREIFELDIQNLTRAETLAELRKNRKLTQHPLFSTFEQTYVAEFSENVSSDFVRGEYIHAIIQYLNTQGK